MNRWSRFPYEVYCYLHTVCGHEIRVLQGWRCPSTCPACGAVGPTRYLRTYSSESLPRSKEGKHELR